MGGQTDRYCKKDSSKLKVSNNFKHTGILKIPVKIMTVQGTVLLYILWLVTNLVLINTGHLTELTWRYLCMNQAAVFPSLTDSTVVSEIPAKSPPQKTLGKLLCIVSGLTSGSPLSLNFNGVIASFTRS